MQEKINHTQQINKRRYTAKKDRKLHVEAWKVSGLSMSEYCRQNNIALASLNDWKRSILRNNTQFKPIQSSPPALGVPTKLNQVVEILVDQHVKIRLQQVSDVSLIINIAKGLMTCS